MPHDRVESLVVFFKYQFFGEQKRSHIPPYDCGQNSRRRLANASCLAKERCLILLKSEIALLKIKKLQSLDNSVSIGNVTVPIQLAQCRFPGMAISNVKILIYF